MGVYLLNLKVSLLVGGIKSGGGAKEGHRLWVLHTPDWVKVRITRLQSAEESSLFNLHMFFLT